MADPRSNMFNSFLYNSLVFEDISDSPMWWFGLEEAPADAVEYFTYGNILEFLDSVFIQRMVNQAFKVKATLDMLRDLDDVETHAAVNEAFIRWCNASMITELNGKWGTFVNSVAT